MGLTSLVAAQFVARLGDGIGTPVIRESLILFGWVASWKPIEMFLYGWLPLVRRRALVRRLAAAEVSIRPY